MAAGIYTSSLPDRGPVVPKTYFPKPAVVVVSTVTVVCFSTFGMPLQSIWL